MQSGTKYETNREPIGKEVVNRNIHNMKIMNENDVQIWDKYWK